MFMFVFMFMFMFMLMLMLMLIWMRWFSMAPTRIWLRSQTKPPNRVDRPGSMEWARTRFRSPGT
jgi:hypothetical protein